MPNSSTRTPNFLANTKRLKTGAWNSLITQPEVKFRTKEALNLYNTDLTFKKNFDDLIQKAIQTDIVEKYNPEL